MALLPVKIGCSKQNIMNKKIKISMNKIFSLVVVVKSSKVSDILENVFFLHLVFACDINIIFINISIILINH